MRISDWSSDVCSSDLARLTAYESAGVGWVRKLQVKIVEDGFSQLRAVFAHLADRCADDATSLFGLFELVVKRIENARADGCGAMAHFIISMVAEILPVLEDRKSVV